MTEHVPEPWRMLAVTIGRVRLFGIYMPNLKAKIPYWEALIEASTPALGRARAGARRFQYLPSLRGRNRRHGRAPRCSSTRSWPPDFAMSGATGIRMGGSIPGTATAATAFALTTRSPRALLARRIGAIRYSHDETDDRTVGSFGAARRNKSVAKTKFRRPSRSRAAARAAADGVPTRAR